MTIPPRIAKVVGTSSNLPGVSGGKTLSKEEVELLTRRQRQPSTSAILVGDIPATSTPEAKQLIVWDAIARQNALNEAQLPTYKVINKDLPTPTNYPTIPGIEKDIYSFRVPDSPEAIPIPTTSPTVIQQTLSLPPLPDQQLELPDLWADPPSGPRPPTRFVGKNPTYGFLEGLQKGVVRGIQYGVGNEGIRSRSALIERAPKQEYNYLPPQGQAGYAVGRVASDIAGHGTRQWGWRAHPEDILYSIAQWYLKQTGGNKIAATFGPYASSLAMGIGSGNYNPLNPTEGGRPSGFQAISPDEEDPRKSTNPVYDLAVERGFFGRKGRLLPWEQFTEERPDVSYDEYAKYKDYLSNKDDNAIRNLTLGMAKGTMDGINGPEVQLMGYSVTPLGAAAALSTLAGIGAGVKRYAAWRK